ncbi:Hint domain-containing protein [Paracoccus saliphilus]|nr:Hint domain-containing protein [Paracoccus saliphilus]SIS73419.1 Hint domain-containing protein [Paracoccus saliphilus]
MPSFYTIDKYSIYTNMIWDPALEAGGQVRGVTFGVQGLAQGDHEAFIARQFGDRDDQYPASVINNYDNEASRYHLNGTDSGALSDVLGLSSPAFGDQSGRLDKIYNVDKFTVTLEDGTVLSQDDLPAGLQIRTLDNGNVWVDVPDTWLDAGGDMRIASIRIAPDAALTSAPFSEWLLYDGIPDNDPEPVVCFTIGTLIETDQGNKPVEELAVGDLICTMDDGYQPIRWIGSTRRDAVDLFHEPKLRPVRIRVGALGNGLPKRDLMVSRQHRVLVKSKIAQRMFGAEEILVPANKLIGLPGIGIADDIDDVTYFHILFDRHQVIFSEDAPTESLFTGPEALKSVPREARKEIETLFPEITDPDFTTEPARVIPGKGMEIKKLIAQHQKHDMPLLNG